LIHGLLLGCALRAGLQAYLVVGIETTKSIYLVSAVRGLRLQFVKPHIAVDEH
jgi:hypothetical protein